MQVVGTFPTRVRGVALVRDVGHGSGVASHAHRPQHRQQQAGPRDGPAGAVVRPTPPQADHDLHGADGRRRLPGGRHAAARPADRRRRHPPEGHRARRQAGPGDGRRVAVRGLAHRGGRLPVLADRRGSHLRPAHQGVRPRPAPVAGVLHPHPDRCAGLPAQQRRDRRPAGVHLDPVQHGLQRHLGRGRRHRDAGAQLAGDAGSVSRSSRCSSSSRAWSAPSSPGWPATRWTATPTWAT